MIDTKYLSRTRLEMYADWVWEIRKSNYNSIRYETLTLGLLKSIAKHMHLAPEITGYKLKKNELFGYNTKKS